MTTSRLALLLSCSFAITADAQEPAAPGPLKDIFTLPTSKTITSYHDVLAYVPPQFRRIKPADWTGPERAQVNEVLTKALHDPKVPVKLRVKTDAIEKWGAGGEWILYSGVPNQEGYQVRVFANFTDQKAVQRIKKGMVISFEGTMGKVRFENLWGQFTLSIPVDACVSAR